MDRLFSAPDSVTQSILIALCDDDRIQARALKYLGELEDYATRRTAATHNDNNNNNNNDDRDLRGGNAGGGGSGAGGLGGGGSNSANPLKRQQRATEPAQICLQCKHAFTPSSNAAEACLYHHGELDVDEEHATWIDWDEAVAGPNDSPENREDYPEAFQWDCCDRNGAQSGCTKGYHVAVRRSSSKRFRPGDSPGGDYVRMFEGRALKANEFVNELLWTDNLDDYTATQSMDGGDGGGGWGTTEYNASQTGKDEEQERTAPNREDLGGGGGAGASQPSPPASRSLGT